MREMEMLQREIKELRGKLAAAEQANSEKNAQSKKAKREFVMTPYQATKIMNAEREKLGLKPVNSPMLYIYASKGKFAISESADGRKQIDDEESFLAWMNTHNAAQLAKQSTTK